MARPNLRLVAIAIAGAGVLTLLMLCGCSTRVEPRHEARLDLRGSGAPAAVVFSDPRRPEMAWAGEEASRLDGALSTRTYAAQMASDQWPEMERVSPRAIRRLQLNARPDSFIYFERESERRGSWRGTPWW